MKRITSKHERSRQHLLDVAQQIFLEKGYSDTSVAAVIDAAGVSKGAFYHYFTSKEDLLDQIVDVWQKARHRRLTKLLSDNAMGPQEKLNMILIADGYAFSERRAAAMAQLKAVMKSMYMPQNQLARTKAEAYLRRTRVPLLCKVISDGIADSTFHTGSPEYVADIVLCFELRIGEVIGQMLVDGKTGKAEIASVTERIRAYEDALSRMLGLPDGSVHLMLGEGLGDFFGDSG